jgi:hypothetical protein
VVLTEEGYTNFGKIVITAVKEKRFAGIQGNCGMDSTVRSKVPPTIIDIRFKN